MNRNTNDAIISFTLPSSQEIPDIGLYLDQVAKYINSYLTDFPDMAVTPSMISNYAKQKLIDRVNRKTYTRTQILTLFLIVLFKNVISIENIRHLLERSGNVTEDYEHFRNCLDQCLKENISDNAVDDILFHIARALSAKMVLEEYFRETVN